MPPGATLVNRYTIDEIIGVGGMGAVYRARDLHFPNVHKWVAVKEMINPSHDPTMRETLVHNFEREANILATLSHPSIPRIYDFFTHSERSYLVLEFIQGEDLETLLKKSEDSISESQIIAWAIQLCDVLHFLHTHQPEPIIFRDIKPSNIMINQYNHVVLVDFGIAKTFDVGARGTMMGTEGYSPPEQYRGEASPLADVYALGATLHHLLTRQNPQMEPPFTFAERPIHKFNPSVSEEMVAIVNKALSYLPEDRYQSADSMKRDLMGMRRRASDTPAITTPQTGPVQNPGQTPAWTFECEDEIRGTPVVESGTVFVGSYDHNLYALDAETGHFLWKYPARGAIVGKPLLSEGFLYFGSEDCYLHVVSPSTGRMLWTYRTEGPVRSSPRVSGEYLFIGSDDGGLHSINLKSGRRLWRFDAGSPVRSTPFVFNNLIYFGSEEGDVFCVDLFGTPKWHFRAKRAVTSSPLVEEGLAYFGSMDGIFYAFDARMGWEIWRRRLGKGSISSPCVVENLVYTGAIDGYIYCMDTSNGREVWSFHTEHQVTGSPVVELGQVFCGSVDGYMYCLEARSGRLRWKFDTGKPITGSAVVMDHMLYFGSTNHRIYALPM